MSEHIRPLRILAVDDDAASAELIVRVAERCGYEAFATSDSRGASTSRRGGGTERRGRAGSVARELSGPDRRTARP